LTERTLMCVVVYSPTLIIAIAVFLKMHTNSPDTGNTNTLKTDWTFIQN